MNCTICGKPVVLVPSAKERAAKDVTGKSADYYTRLFPRHSACELAKREADTRELMQRLKAPPLRAFVFGDWHAWQGTAGVMLSDESTKTLRQFPDADACINWLYLEGHKDAARALNKHAKGTP